MYQNNQEDKFKNIPPQLHKHECQHVDNGACVKCRFPFTWLNYLNKSSRVSDSKVKHDN